MKNKVKKEEVRAKIHSLPVTNLRLYVEQNPQLFIKK